MKHEPRVDIAYVMKRLGMGAVISAVAAVLGIVLWSDAPPSPFLFVYPAVVLAAWWGGWIAGVATTVFSMLALAYFFLPPSSLAVEGRRDILDLVIFCGVSLLLTHFITRTQRALRHSRVALEEAEAATAAKEAVLEVVAHDLRNPLQTIGLGAELLRRELQPQNEAITAQLARIQRCAGRARRLVDNIVDSARIGPNPFPVATAEGPLSDLVEEALTPFKHLADARRIDLQVPDPTSLALRGTIVCDRDRIVQVLSNLVGNALQFTPRGGKISVDVERNSELVRFTITDTGCGMTAHELDHAFDRLWRGQGPGRGCGLGLWISRALVEAHGGRLEATSAPQKGTTMTFFVPTPSAIRVERGSEALVPAQASS